MLKNVRIIAADIIYEVMYKSGYLNKLLQKDYGLSNNDQRLLTTITYGTIKHYIYLEYIFDFHIKDAKIKRLTKVIFLIALYQYLFLDKIPMYAIVDQAVLTAQKRMNKFVAKFVNVTMRNLLTQPKSALIPDFTGLQLNEKLAYQYSVPLWLWQLVSAQYDSETAKKYFSNVQNDPQQFVRINRLKTETVDLLAESLALEPISDISHAYINKSGNIALSPAYQNGQVSIQNLSSQAVGFLVNPKPNDIILDMCAAPGGKTTHLAELADDKISITAYDVHSFRVEQIMANAERLGIQNITAETADAITTQKPNHYTKILLDAPCSGLGVLQQKPEIKYHITPSALDDLIIIQQKLLESAWIQLQDQGELIYSTCTINRKENEKQIDAFLKKHPDAKVLTERLIIDEVEQGYTGFYMTKLKKTKIN